jgi:Sec7-like guanine-nucleotide exchange factor
LSTKGIVFFIDCLVAVSDAEISSDNKKAISGVGRSSAATNTSAPSRFLAGDDGPRIFSLQKLVEVADYNMNVRPRLAWAQMWDRMSEYFVKIGSHENSMVSMFAIDALRQLSFKFLEKPELKDFNFQRLFLRPFLSIMENPSCRENNRELVLRCVDNMIRSVARNLRSGWKIIFSILSLTATDSSEKICTLGLTILQYLLDNHLDKLVCVDDASQSSEPAVLTASEKRERNAHAEDFVSLCRASLSFVSLEMNKRTLTVELSMRALSHAACYADLIAAEKILPPVLCAQVCKKLSRTFEHI